MVTMLDTVPSLNRPTPHGTPQDIAFIDQLCDVIADSEIARMLLDSAASEGWTLALDPLEDAPFHLDYTASILTLSSCGHTVETSNRSAFMCGHALFYRLCFSLLTGLREVWHECRSERDLFAYAPDQILQLERVRYADCAVVSLAVFSQMAEYDSQIWRHALTSDYGDMARVFDDVFSAYTGACDTGFYDAMNAAFDQWFACPVRISEADHAILTEVDDKLQADDMTFGSSLYLQAYDLERLSCLPHRIAYLQNRGEELLFAPHFACLPDDVNRAHLLQITQDMTATIRHGVPFRDKALADQLFPMDK